MSTALPRDLPRTLALFVALPFLAFTASATVTENVAGRPSSTAGIGIVLIPIVGAILGVGAFVVGLLLRWLWHARGGRSFDSPEVGRRLAAALRVACVGAGVAGAAIVLVHEAHAKPAILRDPGVLQHQPWISNGWQRSTAGMVGGGFPPSGREEFPAGTVVVGAGDIRFEPAGGQVPVSLDVDALDYLRVVRAAPLAGATGAEDFVAVLADGRATGQRALLAAFDRNGTVVWEELVARSWDLDEPGLALLHDPTGAAPDAVTVGSDFVLRRVAPRAR